MRFTQKFCGPGNCLGNSPIRGGCPRVISPRRCVIVTCSLVICTVFIAHSSYQNTPDLGSVNNGHPMKRLLSDMTFRPNCQEIKERDVSSEKPPCHRFTELNMTSLLLKQRARIRTLNNACNAKTRPKRIKFARHEDIELDIKTKTLYCPIAKVGSTFLTRLFYGFQTHRTIRTPFDIGIEEAKPTRVPGQHILTKQQSSKRNYVQESEKILFVREPFARLFSAYIDKLFAPNPVYWNNIGRYIVKTYRRYPSAESLRCGHDVTFPEVVKYVIGAQRSGRHKDAHFSPMYERCKPCQMKYTVLGKLESLMEDTWYVINRTGQNISEDSVDIWKAEFAKDAIADSTHGPFEWKEAISQCISFHEACKRIWHKMQIRGVVPKDVKLPLDNKTVMNISAEDFAQLLLKNSSPKPTKEQKRLAIQKSFELVDKNDLEQFRDVYRHDFELFGYDFKPESVFPTQPPCDNETDWIFDLSNL